MNASRVLRRVLLAAVMLSAVAGAPLQAQAAGPSYEVRKGDTLFGIARKTQHDGMTRNLMILAIWRANQGAFPGGNINMLEVGTVLVIPAREIVAAIDPDEADRQVRELLAAKPAAAPPVAAIRPVPAVKAPAKPAPGQEEAARRYREGLAKERRGDHEGALKAFLEAGEAGYGLAQRRLGEIYDRGSPVVKHDYQASLKWYQKAREQGIEIPKPIQRGPVH
jgi:FimV-like protein